MNKKIAILMKYLPVLILLFCSSILAKNERLESELLKIDVKTTKGEFVSIKKIEAPIIIINFWASWCKPCIEEFKSLNELKRLFGKNLFILGINNDEEEPLKKIQKIEEKYNLSFSSVHEESVSYADKFMVSKIPTSLIFVNKKLFKFIPEKFDFMDKDFILKLKKEAKTLH